MAGHDPAILAELARSAVGKPPDACLDSVPRKAGAAFAMKTTPDACLDSGFAGMTEEAPVTPPHLRDPGPPP